MKVILIAFVLFFSFCAFANPAKGVINGKAWTFVAGAAHLQNGSMKIALWNFDQDDPCSVFASSTLKVKAIIPAQLGTFYVSPNGSGPNYIIMGDNSIPGSAANNIIAESGNVNIISISDTIVTGTMTGSLDFMNSFIMGDFTVTNCM